MTKSAFLMTETHRKVLEGRKGADRAEIVSMLSTIDQLGRLHDGLQASSASTSPTETPEARAMRVERQFQTAGAKAKQIATDAAARLERLTAGLETNAIEEAGLAKQSLNASEIRAALRGMKPAERDKAIEAAFENKDTEILSAVFQQNPILWGGNSMGALDVRFKLHINEAAPQAMAEMETVSKAMTSLEMATSAFIEASNGMRQPALAERGQQQQEQHDRAQAALNAALGE